MVRHVSKVVLYDNHGFLIMQKRDHRAPAKNPGTLSFFGGGVEPGETHKAAALRELREETNVLVAERDLQRVHSRYVWDVNELIRVHYYRLDFPVALATLQVYEGKGFERIDPRGAWHEEDFSPLAWRYLRKIRTRKTVR